MAASPYRWEPGRLVGDHYRVERFLDEGSAGEVYAGQNVWTGRNVALKRLHPEHRNQSTVVERFLLEGRIGGRIDHPNIVQTLDMAQEPSDESFFIVQELLQGVGLRKLMQESQRLGYRDALDLLVPLLGALVAVHQHGIVHRDIKPENIFITDSSMGHRIPKLLDFGIAKVRLAQTLTQAGALLGTVDYMAPEQLEGRKDVDRRADVWAVGVLLYELLSGECPFASSNPAQSLSKIIGHDPPPIDELVLDVPPAIAAAVSRAMRKDRQERHESIQQLLEEILRWSAAAQDELDRTLSSRHRTSLPALLEQKVRAGGSTLVPTSMRASVMVSAHRSGQFRLPESLRELAALMNGEHDVPSSQPGDDVADELDASDEITKTRHEVGVLPSVQKADHAAPISRTMLEAGAMQAEALWAIDELVADAYSCLRKHAFSAAFKAAEKAAALLRGEPERRAQLLLLQAEAAYWTGGFDRQETCLLEAFSLVTSTDRVWCRAIAELSDSASKLGVHERLPDLAGELARAHVDRDTAPDYVVACCRLGIALQRAGWPEHVESVLGHLDREMYDLADRHPTVRAWLCLLRSELADHAGDHAHGLELTKEAVAAFEQAGDVRRACVHRGNIGNAAMLLGEYETAERLLRASLEEASSIRLAQAATMRLNLGITLARLGKIDEGQECVTRALRTYVRRGEWSGECSARVYLAEILWMRGNREGAEREALAAVERAHISPVIQAEALSMLSMVQQDRPMESFIAASQAMELLQAVGGVAEGEARIRLAYALALDGLGHHDPAATAYADGRDRLLERASRISDDEWRNSFLEGVPDHARTLQLAQARGVG
jgi:eukaryotic-like serine/threonine-protein kinase